jgi:tetratricopeptide (TPR) repeat protein/DNA-binding CsgD family transcriptional regulator
MRLFKLVIFVLLMMSGFPDLVADNTQDSLRRLQIIREEYLKADLDLHLSQDFIKTDFDSAIYFAKEALTISEQLDDDKEMAITLFNLGKLYMAADSIILAREYMYDALFLAGQRPDCDTLEATINLFLGKSYAMHDNYAEAITYFLRSLHIAEEIDIKELLTDLYDDLGMVMMFLEDYKQALAYFDMAMETSVHIGSQINKANVLRNIGFVLLIRKNYDSADIYFSRALRIYGEERYFPGMAFAHVGLGNADFTREAYASALAHFDAALEVTNSIGMDLRITVPFIETLCLNRLGETYIKLGMLDEAKKVLSRSIAVSKAHAMPGRRAFASKYMSEVYEAQGNIDQALSYFKTYNLLLDSLVSARVVNLVTKLEMEYQYLKIQKEKELEQQRKDAEQQRREMRLKFLVGIAVLLLILIIVIFILYRKNQANKAKQQELTQKNLELEKKNLEKELAFKNKELTTSVMYQLKKNNFIWNISEKLKKIALGLTPENRKSVKAIIKEMEGNMSKESWDEFEFRFNEVHNDFYDNLLKEFPTLTPNELKLSAFLKLNMTTKDIATITYQSTHSITVARYRLRNKLKLERDENLVSFLSKF